MHTYIAFLATNESINTAEITITDTAEAANSAEPFDVCQLSPIQQLFLCDQAAKYIQLSYRLNFAGYTYKKCSLRDSRWPEFFWFRCPPLLLASAKQRPFSENNLIIHLSGSDQPATALVFYSFQGQVGTGTFTLAWMESIDLEILKKVQEVPAEFGLGNVVARFQEV